MGRDRSGRGGISPAMVAHVLRLLAREERLTTDVIAARAGCSEDTVRRLKRGEHWSQQQTDRRGGNPRKIRLALRMLGREPRPAIAQIARRLKMRRETVRALARGDYITQRRA